MLVNILLWALFGLIAGAVAQFIMPGRSTTGFLMTILLGIAGALIGGYLSSILFGWEITDFNFQSFVVAVAGALLLLMLYRLVAPAVSRR
jgi:uncharacterized membrane protein YeaQ/YmgE (transglycosylase-associated protein family)